MSDTSSFTNKTLKGRNLPWLIATLVLDVLMLLVLVFDAAIQELTLTAMVAMRASLTVLLPIPALILSSLISPDHKAILVFWRLKHPLPGSRAFSLYVQKDDRIDLAKLREHVGEFPANEREQNAKWFRLCKLVESDPSVVDSHKNYLLFRDIAAMSLILLPVLPVAMYFGSVDTPHILISTALFLGQYLITAFAARTTGIGFVQNVLAVHASRKVTGSEV